MRRLTGFLMIAGTVLAARGALPDADHDPMVRAQPIQPRTVVFEKFSRKT